MAESVPSVLAAWSNFYVMTGSSAAALTGLMFVVITLVTGKEHTGVRDEGIATFSTPTVMHFCASLLISAILIAPWHSLVPAGALVGLAGLFGVTYILRVMYRTRRQTAYEPDLEDWIWYNFLPFVAYGALLVCAFIILIHSAETLFAIAGAVLLLIVIGIRNAWDIVTFIATGRAERPPDPSPNDQTQIK